MLEDFAPEARPIKPAKMRIIASGNNIVGGAASGYQCQGSRVLEMASSRSTMSRYSTRLHTNSWIMALSYM